MTCSHTTRRRSRSNKPPTNSRKILMICHCKFIQPRTSYRITSNPSILMPPHLLPLIATLPTRSVRWEPDKFNIHTADNGVDPRGSKLHIVSVLVKFWNVMCQNFFTGVILPDEDAVSQAFCRFCWICWFWALSLNSKLQMRLNCPLVILQ
jgi:hypothetical protein